MKKAIKKTVTKKHKTAVKSRTVRKTKSTVSKKALSAKTTKRKGITHHVKHHVKRVYRLTPKFVHGMVVGAFVGIILVSSLGISGNASAQYPQADSCIHSRPINVNSQNANVEVSIDRGCGNRKVELRSFYAPNAQGGADAPGQVLYAKTVTPQRVTPSDGWVKVHVAMFDKNCFYQVDLFDVTNPEPGKKDPFIAAATGGNKDCRPTRTYECRSIGLTPGAGRSALISNFSVGTVNTTFTGATINWGDGQTTSAATALNAQHIYAADGDYIVTVTAHFSFIGDFGNANTGDARPCSAPIGFTTVPVTSKIIAVCEIATLKTLTIDEKLYGTPQYPADKYTTDLTKCVVIPPPTTPLGPTTPSTLAKTGPGAILVVLALSVLGGTLFHRGHKHIQHKRRARQQLHHS